MSTFQGALQDNNAFGDGSRALVAQRQANLPLRRGDKAPYTVDHARGFKTSNSRLKVSAYLYIQSSHPPYANSWAGSNHLAGQDHCQFMLKGSKSLCNNRSLSSHPEKPQLFLSLETSDVEPSRCGLHYSSSRHLHHLVRPSRRSQTHHAPSNAAMTWPAQPEQI